MSYSFYNLIDVFCRLERLNGRQNSFGLRMPVTPMDLRLGAHCEIALPVRVRSGREK